MIYIISLLNNILYYLYFYNYDISVSFSDLIFDWRRGIFTPAIARTSLWTFGIAWAISDAQIFLCFTFIDTVLIPMTFVDTLKIFLELVNKNKCFTKK